MKQLFIICKNNEIYNLLLENNLLASDVKLFNRITDDRLGANDKVLITDDIDFLNKEAGNFRSVLLLFKKKQDITKEDLSYKILICPFKLFELVQVIEKFLYDNYDVKIDNNTYLDTKESKFHIKDKFIYVTEIESLIIKSLIGVYPDSIDKSSLLNILWNSQNPDIESNTVSTHISRLRRKMSGSGIDIIGEDSGYKLNLL